MTARLSIRAATLDDLTTVVELRLALLREYAEHPFYENLKVDARTRAFELYRSQLASPTDTIFLADRERRTVGILRCVEAHGSPLLLPERYCYVSSVYVVPDERRRGVLRALLGAAECWCDERAISEMRLNNSMRSQSARDTWRALGFDSVEEVRRRVVRVPNDSSSVAQSRAGAH